MAFAHGDAYKALSSDDRFIRGLRISDDDALDTGEDIKDADALAAEEYAKDYIDSLLGKEFTVGSVPKLIQYIADLLASAGVWRMAVSQSTAQMGRMEQIEALQSEADKLLKEILGGKRQLLQPDGVVDAEYGGKQGVWFKAGHGTGA